MNERGIGALAPGWLLKFSYAVGLLGIAFSLPCMAADTSGEVNETHWTIRVPFCERDRKAWKRFNPFEEWMDMHVKNWRNSAENRAYFRKHSAYQRAVWRKEDAVDVTWLDIDGDGWCDVITSGEEESHKNEIDKPILLKSPRGIFVRTEKGFKSLKPGAITSEHEGASITVYWNIHEKNAVLVKRIYQGNMVGAGDLHENAFHLREMLRAAFTALAAGDRKVFREYYDEVEPLMYNGALPEDFAEKIWLEEARRTGVEDRFTPPR